MSRVRLLIGLACAGAMAGLVFAFALGSSSAGTARTAQPCQLSSQQPAQPLALNTEAIGPNHIKSVAMEKELFQCQHAGTVPSIVDHETFVEIVEQKGHGQFFTQTRSVEQSICRKDFSAGTISCKVGSVQLAPAVDPTPLKGCAQLAQPGPASEFVAMDSAVSWPFMKTVKVDKEIFDCSQRFAGQPIVGDYYLFTEIVEQDSAAGVTPVSKSFDGIVCFKNLLEALIQSCERFSP